MKLTPFLKIFALSAMLLFAVTSCSEDDAVTVEEEGSATENPTEGEGEGETETPDDTDFTATDWTDATHSKDVDPNHSEVFDDTQVKRLDIVITAERWQSMLDDMVTLYGAFGTATGGQGGGQGGPGGGGQGGGGNTTFADEDPIFVPAEVFYEDKEWYRVGVRFKGNSSLSSTWSSGNLKLSFKLDFDEFEDDYPQIKNQRFYGFKKLSLKNNYNDKSMLREKVAADIFKNAGMVVSHTAFYTVYVDHGDGPTYFGLYTLVEEVDDTVLEDQYGEDDGNLYKPDGDAASFENGTFDADEFVKKNNEDEADWSDIQNLFTALHSDTRTTDAAAWRTGVDAVLDTDTFLKYLAVNTVIQNWDTYGKMTHNYFLYNNSANNKLTWIPWDNNEALQEAGQGTLNLDFSNLTAAQWPLIGYLYADTEYKATYDTYVQETIDNAFKASTIQATYDTYAALIEPYATTEISGHTFLNSSADFQAAVSQLKNHVTQRATAANSYLSN